MADGLDRQGSLSIRPPEAPDSTLIHRQPPTQVPEAPPHRPGLYGISEADTHWGLTFDRYHSLEGSDRG